MVFYSSVLGPLLWTVDLVHDENTFRVHRAISTAEAKPLSARVALIESLLAFLAAELPEQQNALSIAGNTQYFVETISN